MKTRVHTTSAVLLMGLLAAGCARPHETEDERIQRQAAEDTRQIRKDAQNAGVEARKAAEQARRQARDIIAGVREGWQQGAPPGKGGDEHARVDLNTASVAEIDALPGISAAEARAIVRHRPYHSTSELLRRKLVSDAEYDRIADRIRVEP